MKSSRLSPRWFGILALGLALTACGKDPEEPKEAAEKPPEAEVELPPLLLTEAGFDALPGWSADKVVESLPALRLSCRSFLKQPDSRAVGPDGLGGQVADWRPACGAILAEAAEDEKTLRGLLKEHFTPFKVTAPESSEGLFTGYYEAELKGAFRRDAKFRWPLYQRPSDQTASASCSAQSNGFSAIS